MNKSASRPGSRTPAPGTLPSTLYLPPLALPVTTANLGTLAEEMNMRQEALPSKD